MSAGGTSCLCPACVCVCVCVCVCACVCTFESEMPAVHKALLSCPKQLRHAPAMLRMSVCLACIAFGAVAMAAPAPPPPVPPQSLPLRDIALPQGFTIAVYSGMAVLPPLQSELLQD